MRREVVAEGLNFPTSLCFDHRGGAWVAESGLPFDGLRDGGRILRIDEDGGSSVVVEGLRSPVTGLCFADGVFYISEGGNPGRISRMTMDGAVATVLDELPGGGNYHTNMVTVGPGGWLYFSQGAATNMAIVGPDASDLAWLGRLPHPHDLPGMDIVLSGYNASSNGTPGERTTSGAFVPWGTATKPGQRIPAQLPCTASGMRCRPDGSRLELVAWGLRNAWGMGFLRDGRLIATDQGADDRGSRAIGNVPDLLFEVRPGRWYGWPDYIGAVPVTDPRFAPARGPALRFVLANHEQLPGPEPALVELPGNCSAVKFDTIPAGRFGGQLLVALFGDESPLTAPPREPAGRSLMRIDPRDWSCHPCPAGPFDRPIDVGFHPLSGVLTVLDFGRFEMKAGGAFTATRGSGSLTRIFLEDF